MWGRGGVGVGIFWFLLLLLLLLLFFVVVVFFCFVFFLRHGNYGLGHAYFLGEKPLKIIILSLS